jgi:hypothetical protein
VSDQPKVDFCDCVGFKRWYVGDDGTVWCECGHDAAEHIDGRGTCIGEVEILR